MKKNKKIFNRVLSVILVVVMAATAIPFNVFAAEAEPACDHVNTILEWAKYPNCEEDGFVNKVCKDCKAVVEKDIIQKALGHTIVEIKGNDATCTKAGNTKGEKCSVCDKVLSGNEVIPATGHTPVIDEHEKRVEATCTTAGQTEGYHCKECGLVLKEVEKIEALGHDYVVDATKTVAADCKNGTPGTSVEVCSRCKDVKTTTYKAEHVASDDVTVLKEATCTEKGVGVSTCKLCGKKNMGVAIPATGHVETTVEGKAATCTEDGYESYKACSVCKAELTEKKVIKATNHNPEIVPAVAPTCTESGLTETKKCVDCGEMMPQEIVKPLGHNEVVVTKEVKNTCTTDGNTAEIICGRCGTVIQKSEVIPATGHVVNETLEYVVEKKATCTEDGLKKGICKTCETKDVTEVIPATGHKYVKDETKSKDATCAAEGLYYGVCSVCNDVKEEKIACVEHEKTAIGTVVDPTCTEDGKTAMIICKACNSVLEEAAVVPARGHAYGEYAVTKEATCSAEGEKVAECATCGNKDVQDVEKLAHTEVIDAAVNATCTEAGKTEGKHCSVCNEVIVAQEEVAAKGHTIVEDITPATTQADGVHKAYCSACDVSASEIIAKIASVKLSSANVVYNGKVRTPSVIVTDELGNKLVSGEDFEYTYSEDEMKLPGKYTVTVTFKGKYAGTEDLTFVIAAAKTAKITTTSAKNSYVKLSWDEVEGATGYRVYVYKTVDGKTRKRVASVEGTTYNLTKDYAGKALKVGGEYKIAIVAYTKLDDGTVIHAPKGVAATFTRTPGKVTLKATVGTGKMSLKWTNVADETGYQVYYSTTEDGKFKKLANVYDDDFVKAGLKSGTTYYVKVRAFTKIADGNYVYGAFSTIKAVTVK